MPADGATLLLVNPNARSGSDDLAPLVDAMEALGRVLRPECEGEDAVRAAIARHADSVARIVVGGGDGSINAALPAVLESGLPLGVIPLGTANDFARSLGIPDVPTAVSAIERGRTRKIDVGVINGHHFLNAAGIGLGPEINRDLDEGSKGSFGALAYVLQGVRNLRDNRGMHAVIECDGSSYSVRSLQITIANGIHYGGGMTVSRDARLDDGMLDVLSIPPQSPWRLLLKGPAIRAGAADSVPGLQTFRARQVSVRTRRPMDVTADGEPVTRTPVECHTIAGRLRVYAPETGTRT